MTRREEAIRMFRDGMTRKDIAENMGVSYCAVLKWLAGMSAADPVRFLPRSLMEDWDQTTAWLRRACGYVSDR